MYALGLLLYRLLSHRPPWRVETTTQMLTAHVYVEPDPLPPIFGLPDAVAELCQACLAKEPADRPPASQVAAVLADAAGLKPRPDDDPHPVDHAAAVPNEPAKPAAVAGARAGWAPPVEPGPALAKAGAEGLRMVGPGQGAKRRQRIPLLVGAAVATAAVIVATFAFLGPLNGSAERSSDAARGADATAAATITGGQAADGGGVPSGGSSPTASGTAGPPGGPATQPDPNGPAAPVQTTPGPGGGGPGPTTGAPPLPRTPLPSPSNQTTLTSRGGSVVAECQGLMVNIVSVVAAPGYELLGKRPPYAPAAQIVIMFQGPDRVQMRIRCDGGVPSATSEVV